MSDTEATKSVHEEDAKSGLEEQLGVVPNDEMTVIDDRGATPENKEGEEATGAVVAEPEADAKELPNEDADEAEANAEDAEKAAEKPAEVAAEAEAGAQAETASENPMFRKAFSMFDLDESGEISAGEFGTVMRALGENPTDEDIETLLKSVDRDLDGKLSYGEFQTLMQKRMESRDELPEDELFRRAFRVFDKDGSGKLSKEELRNVVTSYGQMKLSMEDAEEMLASADADGDDMVDYEEFIAMFCSGPVEVEP